MNVLASKLICVFFQIICFVIHTANLFMTDICLLHCLLGAAREGGVAPVCRFLR